MSTVEAPTKEKPWTTGAVYAALRERFPSPEYAFLAEVADSTGFSASRSADAIAMGCWPSRGLLLTGFEVKVSRSDWLRELKDPAKAEQICRFCDRWYLVAGAKGIVKDGELPATWGLIEPRGAKLAISKEAPELTPQPIDRSFLAALLRRAAEQLGDRSKVEEEIKRARWAAQEEGKKLGAQHAQTDLKRSEMELKHLKERLQTFESRSGVKIDQWHAGKIGDAVKMLVSGGLDRFERDLREAERTAKEVVELVGTWQETKSRMSLDAVLDDEPPV